MTDKKKVLFLGGDGIGPEVVAEARRIAAWFLEHGLNATLSDGLYGMSQYRIDGRLISVDVLMQCKQADAIIFGATGGAEIEALPADVIESGGLLFLRRELDLFANLRPIKAIDALRDASTLKPNVIKDVDFVFVRELCGGIYFGTPRGIEALPNGQRRGVDTQVYTSGEIRRVARVAFELARSRNKRLCSVEKSNVMESGKLWREEVQRMQAEEFADVELTHMYADNCAMQLVRRPSQFDVILADNLFGDILSDCAAMICGSLGMLPSASLSAPDERGRHNALYEPIHGSAPDIAGKSLANPLATILSFAMALRHSLGAAGDADLLEQAVRKALDDGARTADMAGPDERKLSTVGMGDAVIRALEELSAPSAQ